MFAAKIYTQALLAKTLVMTIDDPGKYFFRLKKRIIWFLI